MGILGGNDPSASDFPGWVTEGLDQSKTLANMENYLSILAKDKISAKKAEEVSNTKIKEVNNNFDKVSSGLKTASENLSAFDKAAAGTASEEKKREAQRAKYTKTLGDHTADLASTLHSKGLGTALSSFSSKIMEVGEKLGPLGTVVGIATGILGELFYILEENSKGYYLLNERGIVLSDNFAGLEKASAKANMGVADFTKILLGNSDILATAGSGGSDAFVEFIHRMTIGNESVATLGYTLDQASEEATTWLHIQKAQNNLRGFRDMRDNADFNSFLENIGDLSMVMGVSRDAIAKAALKAASDPSWYAYQASLGQGTEKQKAANASLESVSTAFSASLGDQADDMTKLFTQLSIPGGRLSEDMIKFRGELQNTSPVTAAYIQQLAISSQQGAILDAKDVARQLKKTADLSADQKEVNRIQAQHNEGIGKLNMAFGQLSQASDNLTEEKLKESRKQKEANDGIEKFDNAIKELVRGFKLGFISAFGNGGLFNDALNNFSKVLTDDITPAMVAFGTLIGDLFNTDKIKSAAAWDKLINTLGQLLADVITKVTQLLVTQLLPSDSMGFSHLISLFTGSYKQTTSTPSSTTSTGIGSTPSSTTSTGIGSAPTAGSVGANSAKMMDYFTSQGWSKEQAAGIVANLQLESKLDPTAVGDNHQAYGLAQWHPDRQAAFAAWAGHDIKTASLEEQLAFVNYELRSGSEQKAGRKLSTASSAFEAGRIVDTRYERSANILGMDAYKRGKLAENIYSTTPTPEVAMGGSVVSPTVTGTEATLPGTPPPGFWQSISDNLSMLVVSSNASNTHLQSVVKNTKDSGVNY